MNKRVNNQVTELMANLYDKCTHLGRKYEFKFDNSAPSINHENKLN